MDFAPACIKVLHGLGSILSYLHCMLSTCCSSSSVMIQILLSQPKFFRDDTNLTVTAQVLHIV